MLLDIEWHAIRSSTKYDVEYIYIGTLEQETYESEGLQKFATQLEDYHPVYGHEGVTIFKVRGE